MAEEKTEAEILEWFEKTLLPRLISEGKFPLPEVDPQDLVQVSLQYEETERGTDHFASVPYFISLTLQDGTNSSKIKQFHLVVKFISQKTAVRTAMELDVQFYNEMVFYNEVLPTFEYFLKGRPGVPSDFLSDICPVCPYSHIDLEDPDYGVVIMDDLRKSNFVCAKSKVELDLDYIVLGVQKLAKLHAVSYAMKLEKFPGFEKLTQSFKECRYQSDDRYKKETMGYFHKTSGLRGINYLLSKPNSEVPETYLNNLKKKIDGGAYEAMEVLVLPKEPLAIICHGDFCRNNILYRLENGRPVDCKLFDYQTWRYANPAIDLTFFIYMNSTLELRESHFDEILRSYHNTIIKTVCAITNKTVDEITRHLPFEAFEKDFGDHSWYGYAIAAFFLPMMMAPKDDPIDFEDEWSNSTPQQMAEDNAKQGGEPVTQRIAEILIDMYRRKFCVK